MKVFKGLNRFLFIIIIVIFLFIPNKIRANSSSKLLNFNFITEKYYLIDRVKVSISFDTTEKLNYFSIRSILVNGHEELSYETGRANENDLYETAPINEDDYWHYKLDFDIEYEQVGTIQMIFTYDFELGSPASNRYVDTFYLTTGKWVENFTNSRAISTGIIITILITIGTQIIISMSKKRLFGYEKIEGDNNQESEHNGNDE